VKPLLGGPQLPPPDDEEPLPRLEPVSTPTALKLRSVDRESQDGQGGLRPSEYSDMDIFTSKTCPHFWHR